MKDRNLRYGVVISIITLFVTLLGTLFITNRVLNLIGDYNYGLYSFVNSITTWLTVVSTALVASYLRFASLEAKNNENDISKTNSLYLKTLLLISLPSLIIGELIIVFLFVFKVNFASYDWEDSKIIYFLFAFSLLNISISFPATVFSQYINYKQKFIFEKSVLLITTILQFIIHFLIAFFTKSILLIAVYAVFSTLFTLALNYIFCKKSLGIKFGKFKFSENKSLVKSVIAFSSVLVLNSVVDQISQQTDKTLLGFFSSPENVTIYQMGMQLSTYLSMMGVAVSSVFAPRIYELYVDGKHEEINTTFLFVSRIQAVIATFISFGFVACGHDFVMWWLGPKRINAYYCGATLMVLNIMSLSTKLSIDVQRAANKHGFRSVLYLTAAIINITISIVLLILMPKEHAVFACLIGTVISNVICQWIIMTIYNKKVIRLPMEKHIIQVGKLILFGAASVTVSVLSGLLLLKGYNSFFIRFVVEGAVYVAVYVFLLLLFDRRFLVGVLSRKRAKGGAENGASN